MIEKKRQSAIGGNMYTLTELMEELLGDGLNETGPAEFEALSDED